MPGALWLGKPVREVAERCATYDGDQAEGGGGDAGTCVHSVEKQHQTNHRYGWKSNECNANWHGKSLDHIKASITRTRQIRGQNRERNRTP